MAYLIFHYKCQANFGVFFPFDEDPRKVIASSCVAVYEDGKIISYDRNILDQKLNEKIKQVENADTLNKEFYRR